MRPADLARQRHQIAAAVQALTDRTIEDLQRRARHTTRRDGYPTATLGDGGSPGGAPGAVHLTSVEAAANQRAYPDTGEDVDAEGHPPSDEAGDALRELVAALARMERDATAVIRCLGFLNHVGESARGRQDSTAGDCQACERNVAGTDIDRLRSGYCHACYAAWRREGLSDRPTFERSRRPEPASRETVGA